MDMEHHRQTRRAQRARRFLTTWLTLCLVVGGLLGPSLLAPTASIAAPLPQAQTDQATLGKTQESTFSPDGFASYGEVITYTLRFTVTAGETLNNVALVDTFGQGGEAYLPVHYLDAQGPYATGCTVNPVVPTVDPIEPQPQITWDIGTVSAAGTPCIVEIPYQVRAYFDGDGNAYRRTHNEAVLTWDTGSANAARETILLQPTNFGFGIAQTPPTGSMVNPGGVVQWQTQIQNYYWDREGAGYELYVTNTLPLEMEFPPTVDPPTHSQELNEIAWYQDALPVNDGAQFNASMSLPDTGNVAHNYIENVANAGWSSCPAPCTGGRTYAAATAIALFYVQNVQIIKSQTSPVSSGNADYQAVAGELVHITAHLVVPQGTIVYRPFARMYLWDGLVFDSMIDPPGNPTPITDPALQDPYHPGGRWTELTWGEIAPEIDASSGPVTVTYELYARVQQNYFLQGVTSEINHGEALPIAPMLRWSDEAGVPPDPANNYLYSLNADNYFPVSVQFVRPDLRSEYVGSGSYFEYDAPSGFGSGEPLNFTLHLMNRANRPTAYNIVLSDTLSANLDYQGATPAPDDVTTLPDGRTRLMWNLSSPVDMPPDEQPFVINCLLPTDFVGGTAFSSTARASYSTFSGTPAGEGQYYDGPGAPWPYPPYTARSIVQGGLELVKSVDPEDNVAIGDTVDYTLILTLNRGLAIYQPYLTDTLPLGFHYVDGSLDPGSGTIIEGPTMTVDPSGQREVVFWRLATLDNRSGSQALVVTMRYQAQMTGRNVAGQDVYAGGGGDFLNKWQSTNSINSCWSGSEGGTVEYCLAQPTQATTWVVQPYLAYNLAKSRLTAGLEYEVGDQIQFQVDVYNAGYGYAYEVEIGDVLPPGLTFVDTLPLGWDPPGSEPVSLIDEPNPGDMDLVSWTLNQLAPGQTVHLYYLTEVGAGSVVGYPQTNSAHVIDYTSQSGSANPYDRHYADYDGLYPGDPIPDPVSGAAYYVLGIGAYKNGSPDPVGPGGTLNYTINFGNSSQEGSASSVTIVDTYDPNLTFVSEDHSGNPSQVNYLGHSPGARTLTWEVPGGIPAGGSLNDYHINLVFTVGQPFDQDNPYIVNQVDIDGTGDATGPQQIFVTTTVSLPYLGATAAGNPPSVHPGEQVVYTIQYNNSGTLDATGTILEAIYDPSLSFVSANPAPDPGYDNRWSLGSLGIGGSGQIQVTALVDIPVPALVDTVYLTPTIQSNEVLPVTGIPAATSLIVPWFENLVKIGPPGPVQEGQQVGYQISYVNEGDTATNVVLTDIFGEYMEFADATPYPDGFGVDSCYWNLGTLNPGASGTIFVTAQVDPDVPADVRFLVNTAQIACDQVGPRVVTEETRFGRIYIYLPLISKGY